MKNLFLVILTLFCIILAIQVITYSNLSETYKNKYLSSEIDCDILESKYKSLYQDYALLCTSTANNWLSQTDSLVITQIAQSPKYSNTSIVPKTEMGYKYGLQYGYELPAILNFLKASLPDSIKEKRLILEILNDKKYKNETNQKGLFLKMIQDFIKLNKSHF